MSVFLRAVRLGAGGPVGDVLVEDDRVAAVGPTLERPAGVEELTGSDLTVVPGLVDAHVHLTQWALARQRIDVSGSRSPGDVADAISTALTAQPRPAGELVTAYGFRDSDWSEPPDARLLQRALPNRPVLVISNDLHTAWLSPAAGGSVGDGLPETGVVREAVALEIMAELGAIDRSVLDRLAHDALAEAATRGVTSLIDFEVADNVTAWRRRADGGRLPVRVSATVYPEHLDAAIAAGHRHDDVVDDTAGLVRVGPVKVFVDGSLNARTAWCWEPYVGGGQDDVGVVTTAPDDLVRIMRAASAAGLRPAVHAIGDRAVEIALDGFERLGIGGRIEHAQLIRPDDVRRMARLGLVAGIQPMHALDDRSVAERLWGDRLGHAFAHGTLARAGVTVEIGSDAPVSPLDPWLGITAAVWRTLGSTSPWRPDEVLDIGPALAAAAGGRGRLAVGDVADIAVVRGDPARMGPGELAAPHVAATMLAGRWTWRAT